MKAIGYTRALPIQDKDSLLERDVPIPSPGPRDLLVKVQAISINPVDTKVRKGGMQIGEGDFSIPGWDVAGQVVETGSSVTQFKAGDAVYYAGSITRSGGNSEFHAVDERIVGHRPKSLTPLQAAALPLTTLTAWEALFDRMKLSRKENYNGKVLLVIGGAGGVGSIAIQFGKKLLGLTVVATASRPDSKAWCKSLGADWIVDHTKGLVAEFKALDLPGADYILCATDTDPYFETMVQLVRPQGSICSIVETSTNLPLGKLMQKSATFSWELMFTRAKFQTEDMNAQGDILNHMAELIDSGTITGTANNPLGPITLENVRRGHELIESGKAIGKVVLGTA